MKTIAAALLVIVMLIGSQLGTFGDEVDNLLGGMIIARGGTLYMDYWSHHMPLAYHLSAVMYAVGARLYTHYRLLWALLVWVGGLALWRSLPRTRSRLALLALALLAPLIGTQMLVAESVVAYSAIAAWLLLSTDRQAAPL